MTQEQFLTMLGFFFSIEARLTKGKTSFIYTIISILCFAIALFSSFF